MKKLLNIQINKGGNNVENANFSFSLNQGAIISSVDVDMKFAIIVEYNGKTVIVQYGKKVI